MQVTIELEIYKVEHFSYGDSSKIIFRDEKSVNYDNYESLEVDIKKLANLTRKKCSGNQEFTILAKVDNFTLATYYSYVSPINTHLKRGYTQQYEDWDTVVSIIEKYGRPKKVRVKRPDFNLSKALVNQAYAMQILRECAQLNDGVKRYINPAQSNGWDGEIVGFEFSNNKILVNCYWQGDKTDGNKFVELKNIEPIKFVASERQSNGLKREFYVQFSKNDVWKAVQRLISTIF